MQWLYARNEAVPAMTLLAAAAQGTFNGDSTTADDNASVRSHASADQVHTCTHSYIHSCSEVLPVDSM